MRWAQTAQQSAWWQRVAFPVIRDIAAVGTGLYLIISQNQSPSPSATMVTAGLILVAPIAGVHAYQLLAGPSSTQHGGPPSSVPASPSSSSPSSSSHPPGVTGEGAPGAAAP